MSQIRELNALHPAFTRIAQEWILACKRRKIDLLIVETLRTWETMVAYYSRGRRPLEIVNDLYLKADLRPITAEENEHTITNAMAGRSWHWLGLAIDAVPLVNGKADWNYNPTDPTDYFDEIAEEAKRLGMIWGGKFRTFPDCPHVEYHPGWKTTDIKQAAIVHTQLGHIPLKGVWGDKNFNFPD